MKNKIAILGAGMIGSAIAKALLKGKYQGSITVTDYLPKKIMEMKELGVAATSDNKEACRKSNIIFICVKPGDVKQLLNENSEELKGKLVISAAATLPLSFLEVHPTAYD